MSTIEIIQQELKAQGSAEKANFHLRFFKTQPGSYGAGDQFIGVTVPQQRKVARQYYEKATLQETITLLKSPVHEYRLTALLILVLQFQKSKSESAQKEIIDAYLQNLNWVNNWDLVDTSAADLLGAYLFNKPKDLLYQLAEENHLWKQRIAIIATYYFIKKHQFKDTLAIALLLLHHPHDLIHKAVGWMLRETGNRHFEAEYNFLQQHYHTMPRTMLRYAIEKFDPELRQQFLKGTI